MKYFEILFLIAFSGTLFLTIMVFSGHWFVGLVPTIFLTGNYLLSLLLSNFIQNKLFGAVAFVFVFTGAPLLFEMMLVGKLQSSHRVGGVDHVVDGVMTADGILSTVTACALIAGIVVLAKPFLRRLIER